MSIGKFESLELHSDTKESLSKRLDSMSHAAQSLLFELKEFRGFISDPSIFDEREEVVVPEGGDFYTEVQRFEIGLIEEALKLSNGNRSRAARQLSLKVSTLNSKIKRYKLDPTSYQDSELHTVG
jgi:transcriptional regulator with PAS, ATPase and Fis domain